MTAGGALGGILVLDVSRMLPGAVLARELIRLGARVVKIEAPDVGDPLRAVPPIVEGAGAGFRAFYAGAESVCIDLRSPEGARALRRLARHADVLVESFRPGTLESWGAGPRRLVELNPGLVVCSLSSHGQQSDRVGHDLNVAAESGLLTLVGTETTPRIQIVDVAAGLSACSAILAALLVRTQTGRGAVLDVPLAAAVRPFLRLAASERAAGGGGAAERLLSGACPAYGIYVGRDGERIAVGTLEPKFWTEFVAMIGLPALAGAGLEADETARAAVAARLAEEPAEHWVRLSTERNLPVSLVAEVDPAIAAPDGLAVPRLGEHTRAVLTMFGFDDAEISAVTT